MAIALVRQGTMAVGTTSASPTFGQATTAGNFLVARVIGTGGSAISTPSGWSVAAANTGNQIYIFYKANCAANETAPSFNMATGSVAAADLAEYSGVANVSPVDQSATASGNFPITNAAADAQAGDLVVVAFSQAFTKSATYTINSVTWTPSGGTVVNTQSTATTKALYLLLASSYITSANTAADSFTASITPSTGTVQGFPISAICSFKPLVPISAAATLNAAASLSSAAYKPATLPPDGILTQTNLVGALSTITADPNSPDSTYMIGAAGTAPVLRVSFGSPGGTLTSGAGLQTFRIRARKS